MLLGQNSYKWFVWGGDAILNATHKRGMGGGVISGLLCVGTSHTSSGLCSGKIAWRERPLAMQEGDKHCCTFLESFTARRFTPNPHPSVSDRNSFTGIYQPTKLFIGHGFTLLGPSGKFRSLVWKFIFCHLMVIKLTDNWQKYIVWCTVTYT